MLQYTDDQLSSERVRDRRMYIFNDRVLWTTMNFEFRGQFSLRNRSLTIKDVEKANRYAFVVGFVGGSAVFGCCTEGEKVDWIRTILEAAADLLVVSSSVQ